ncbi:hypothetical protein LshimejAT787_2100670 [Lyophyllum shimeji]|uniref:JmjC domain-containing protein n=1 Tax=Lyophyllum shimeji TaxID=47721 RepID=A0A9P3PYB3_LYOSH|nr:hypothetical protein LshimejAT787_2100670 [Lyophyllum shimeji]
MLLLPRSYDQFVGKAAILQSWSQFGSIVRPPSVVAADTAIWKVLFATTKGGDVLAELRVALSDLEPVLGGATSAWFTLTKDKSLLRAPTASTSGLADIDSDNEDGPSASCGPPDEIVSVLNPLVQGSSATAGTVLAPSVENPSPQAESSERAEVTAALAPADGVTPLRPSDGPSDEPSGGIVGTSGCPASPVTAGDTALLPASDLRHRSPEPDATSLDEALPASAVGAGSDVDMSSDLTDAPPSRSPSLPAVVKRPVPSTKPVTRGSKKGERSAPKPSYSSSLSKPLKRRAKIIKKETAPGIPKVPRKPTFIDLTLEDSDNEISDQRLDVNPDTGFTTGDVRVSYPLAGSSVFYTWMPKFHLPTDIKWFYDLDSAVRRSASRPAPIRQITHGEYVSLGPADVMDILRSHACIVVVDQPHVDAGFTPATFSEFCRLDEPTTIHDFSIVNGPRTRKGTVLDLLKASRLPNPPALSALHLPSAYDMYPNLPFSSDWAVWRQVQGEAYCRYTELYPVPHMRWAIASTGSANHFWHFDANGLLTFLRVETGIKFWYIAVPKDGDFRVFMQPEVMTKFELDESNEDLWDVYVIVLHPGTLLIMRPSLPHCVVTPEPAICSGGHAIAVATISDSVVGAYHHFIGAASYTNTDHFHASHSVLMRLLVFFQLKLFADPPESSPHMPDISTWDGFLTVIYLCIYFELVSALVGWDYSNDIRGFEASIKNRSRARDLLYHVFSRYKFVGPSGTLTGLDAFELIYSEFLAHHARLLVRYKELAVKRNVKGVDTSRTVSSVAAAVFDCIRGGPASSIYADDAPGDAPGSFAWHGPTYVIQPNSEPVEYDFPYRHGYVYGDIKAAESLGFNIDPVFLGALFAVDETREDDEDDGDDDSDDDDEDDVDSENMSMNDADDDSDGDGDSGKDDDSDGGGNSEDRGDDSDRDANDDGGVDGSRSDDGDDEEESDEDAIHVRSSRPETSQKRTRSGSRTQDVSARKKARHGPDFDSRM